MAKKIGTSRPMNLDVLLPPFIESFSIVPSDAVSQWHYDQDGSFLPDRSITSLLLTPTLNVFDPETKRTYVPSFGKVHWYILNSATKKYDTEITNTADGDVDYVLLPSGVLKVKKNVDETAPVSLLCVAPYVDPRNPGKTYTCRAIQQLTTSRDTSITSPTLEIDQETTVKYNPFIDGYTTDSYGVSHYNFTFVATARMGESLLDVTGANSPYRIRWYALGDGVTSETLIDAVESAGGTNVSKFPCYVSGQGTPTLVLDAMMTDDITIIGRVINTKTGRLYPEKCLRRLTWDVFKIDATSEAIDGGAVKQATNDKTFRNIVTIRNRTIDQSIVNENFIQEWRFRNAASSTVQSMPPGPTVRIDAATLKAQQSSLVYSELSLLGAHKVVMGYDSYTPVYASDGKTVVGLTGVGTAKVVVDDSTGRVVVGRD